MKYLLFDIKCHLSAEREISLCQIFNFEQFEEGNS